MSLYIRCVENLGEILYKNLFVFGSHPSTKYNKTYGWRQRVGYFFHVMFIFMLWQEASIPNYICRSVHWSNFETNSKKFKIFQNIENEARLILECWRRSNLERMMGEGYGMDKILNLILVTQLLPLSGMNRCIQCLNTFLSANQIFSPWSSLIKTDHDSWLCLADLIKSILSTTISILIYFDICDL